MSLIAALAAEMLPLILQVNQSKDNHEDINLALLYSILTEPATASKVGGLVARFYCTCAYPSSRHIPPPPISPFSPSIRVLPHLSLFSSSSISLLPLSLLPTHHLLRPSLPQQYHTLTLVNRDSFSLVISYAEKMMMEKTTKLQETTRIQVSPTPAVVGVISQPW